MKIVDKHDSISQPELMREYYDADIITKVQRSGFSKILQKLEFAGYIKKEKRASGRGLPENLIIGVKKNWKLNQEKQ